MKKNLLIASALVVSGGLMAQSTQLNPAYDVKAPNKVVNEGELSFQAAVNYGGVKPNTPNNKVITVIPLGNSGNAYTCGFGPKTFLWADPNLNAISFSHRTDPNITGDGTTGWLRVDFSTDGGNTWSVNQGPVYDASMNSNARYPQGLLVSSAGNTDPAQAYFTYFAPTLHGSNSSWGGYGYGVYKLDGTVITQHEDVSTASMFRLIPSSLFLTQTGVLWNIDVEGDGVNNGYDYTDSLILSTGVLFSGDVSYIYNKLYAPSTLDNNGKHNMVDAVMAFAPNGMTGYIAIIGHNDYVFQPDSSYYLYTYKTTDGGGSWAGPTNIDISNLPGVVNALGTGAYTTGFELDIAVDSNGNPHIVCAIGPSSFANGGSGWSINTTPGAWGIFDVTSTDGGTTWDAMLIAKPMTFRGTFGDLSGNYIPEDSRPQVGINWTGDKVFYTYFDTDTNIFGSQDGNLYPDAWVAGYDITTGNMAPARNVTAGTNADGVTTFGNMSYYVFDDGNGTYTVPISFQQLSTTSDVLAATQHQYLNGVVLTDADFNSIASIENNENISLYPNPTTGVITLNVTGSQYSYEVLDITGKIIVNNTVATAAKAVIDLSKYPSGIYFVKVNTANGSFMQKVVLSK